MLASGKNREVNKLLDECHRLDAEWFHLNLGTDGDDGRNKPGMRWCKILDRD